MFLKLYSLYSTKGAPPFYRVRKETPTEPSIYSLPPSSLITSLIWTLIRLTQRRIRPWLIISQHSSHLLSNSFLDVEAPRFVVYYFIYYYIGLIIFKLGEFPGHKSLIIFYKLKTFELYLYECDGTPFSIT